MPNGVELAAGDLSNPVGLAPHLHGVAGSEADVSFLSAADPMRASATATYVYVLDGEQTAALVRIGMAAAVAASHARSGKCGNDLIGMDEHRKDADVVAWFPLGVFHERDRGPRPAPGSA